jgi:D-arabinose 1-dehydrogenase-like Zn-dependent alcohol dehydrogenase
LRLGAGDSAAGAGQVRIRVHACGICFSDHYVKDRFWPGLTFPRTSEHEVAGTIDEVGAGVTTWKKGQRVGVGWHGGQDGTCISCRRGDFGNCVAGKSLRSLMTVVMRSIVAPVEAVASMPESLDPVEAAPSLYAGSPRLMHCGTPRYAGRFGGSVGHRQVGHLGVQFASKFGYRVVAISRGKENGRGSRDSDDSAERKAHDGFVSGSGREFLRIRRTPCGLRR